MPKTVFVTGAAGFIGSHVTEALLRRGDSVIGIDNFNDYYSPDQKRQNLEEVRAIGGDALKFHEVDIRDQDALAGLMADNRPDCIAHLAAMAGVRASIEQPVLYYDVNVGGLLRLLNASMETSAPDSRPHVVAASTSSVYGATDRIPFVEDDPCDRPLAPYSASKRAAELIGYSYNNLHGMKFTFLRFFTVYGPRNRPDMMAYKLLDSVFAGREVQLYEGKEIRRDWTFVEDVVDGVVRAVDRPLDYELINIGRGEPVDLHEFVRTVQNVTGHEANLTSAPMPLADMAVTYADISKARELLGYDPSTSVTEGVERLVDWYTNRPNRKT